MTAPAVEAVRRFHLDHFGAEESKDAPGHRAGPGGGEVEHAQPRERTASLCALCIFWPGHRRAATPWSNFAMAAQHTQIIQPELRRRTSHMPRRCAHAERRTENWPRPGRRLDTLP